MLVLFLESLVPGDFAVLRAHGLWVARECEVIGDDEDLARDWLFSNAKVA